MPTISPSMVPTKAPGTIFSNLTGADETLNIRWLTAVDPAYFEVLNRPMADITVRQLVIAKAVDALQLRLGHENLFPYLIQPRISSGSDEVDVPVGWIWDLHASLPKKWENLRLAKIKRIAGTNGTTNGYTGWLRLIFTANVENSSTEVAVLQVDYQIDSVLTYQPSRLSVVVSPEESAVISDGELETVAGFIIFRTLDTDDETIQSFLDVVAPPTDITDADADGYFDAPAIYEITDSSPGGESITDDFSTTALSHGTGLLTDSAWNAIPQLDSDIQSWITSFNYPFDAGATRTSVDSIIIPNGLFREFDIAVPAGDQPSGDTSGTFYPVWINRIERTGTGGNSLRIFFATYNVTDEEADGSPSTTPVEFATLDLTKTSSPGDIVEIVPLIDLLLQDSVDFQQHFGRGHVVLSSLWDGTTSDIDDFFAAFDLIANSPADTEYTQSATRLSSFGLSRVPKYVPTIGQARALLGSSARRSTPIVPSIDNRYITEQDQGLGNQIDLEAEDGITSHAAIDRYGYSGSLAHQTIRLVVNADQLGTDPTFYDTQILPRLRVLFGRDPIFGDEWYNGTRWMRYNGDSWQG